MNKGLRVWPVCAIAPFVGQMHSDRVLGIRRVLYETNLYACPALLFICVRDTSLNRQSFIGRPFISLPIAQLGEQIGPRLGLYPKRWNLCSAA